MQPYNYLLTHGEDPVEAYEKTYADIMRNIEFRTWCVVHASLSSGLGAWCA